MPLPSGLKVDLDEYVSVRPRGVPRVTNYKRTGWGAHIGTLPMDGHWEGDNKWVTPSQTYVREGGKGGKWKNEKGEVIADCNEGPKQPEAESTRRLRESLRESRQSQAGPSGGGGPAWGGRGGPGGQPGWQGNRGGGPSGQQGWGNQQHGRGDQQQGWGGGQPGGWWS
ncbi:hypothetical protein BKA61DRAFT_649584 [Leptodontidium sp. MPI-SDFR-AT-0119]|nr:hypothetical protein BKA61DRAFT_649584 [Leptodontidium sp. MPI-SDFR-AT-0119]